MTFGQRLRALRHANGLTIYEVADAIGRDYTYVSKIENDRVLPPSAEIIVSLATLLGADPEELAILGDKPPIGVIRQRLAQVSEAASLVAHRWDRLARCEDEFYPEYPGSCAEDQQALDEAILSLMRIVAPDLWESRQQVDADHHGGPRCRQPVSTRAGARTIPTTTCLTGCPSTSSTI